MKQKFFFTKSLLLIEAVNALILIAFVLMVAFTYHSLPDLIPSHFNGMGEVDQYAGKGTLLLLPIVTVILYGILTALLFFPQVWNTPVETTEQYTIKVYQWIRNMVSLTKMIMLLVFFYIGSNMMVGTSLSPWFLPLTLFSTFGVILYYTVKMILLKKA